MCVCVCLCLQSYELEEILSDDVLVYVVCASLIVCVIYVSLKNKMENWIWMNLPIPLPVYYAVGSWQLERTINQWGCISVCIKYLCICIRDLIYFPIFKIGFRRNVQYSEKSIAHIWCVKNRFLEMFVEFCKIIIFPFSIITISVYGSE